MKIPHSVLAVLSQAMASLPNTGMLFCLLYASTQQDYVNFVLFINTYMLLLGFQNAMFLTPVGTLVPRMHDTVIRESDRTCGRLAAILALVGLPIVLHPLGRDLTRADAWLQGTLAFIAIIALLRREIVRNAARVRSDMRALLRMDMSYLFVVGTFVSIVFLARLDLTFVVALAIFSLPALLSGYVRFGWRVPRGTGRPIDIETMDGRFWAEVRLGAAWAVPGVLVSWAFGNGYLHVLKYSSGDQVVAELSAARLVFTPIGLMVQGCIQYFRPHAVQAAYDGKTWELHASVKKFLAAGISAVIFFTIAAIGILHFLASYLPPALTNPQTNQHVVLWGLYFSLLWVRSTLTTLLLCRTERFKHVFMTGLLGCVVFYAFLLCTIHLSPILGCMFGLIAAEVVMAAIQYMQVRKDQLI